MSNSIKRWVMMLVGVIGLGYAMSVQAEEAVTPPEGFSFEVVRPDNQRDLKVGYFDLTMVPGAKQTVVVNLFNSSDKEIKVGIELTSAKTNSNGVIEYGPTTIKKDASLKYDIAELIEVAKEVTLPAKSQVPLELKISMPESSFEGVISGGIQIQELETDKDTKTEGMVVNKFAYLTGILLSEAPTDQTGELKLNDVYPELKNGRNSILVNFSNIQPVYLEDMTVDIQVMAKETDQVLYDTKKTNMRMAPNTLIDFPVSMNGEKMVPGDYRAKILVTTKAGGKWEWLEVFRITDEEADKYNEQDVGLVQEQGIDWTIILLIVGGVCLVLVIIVTVIILVNRRKKKTSDKKSKKRKTS